MSSSQSTALLAEWDDLPDPRDPQAPEGRRIAVRVDRAVWEHIATKHVANRREPWDELLSPETRRALLEGTTGGEEGRRSVEQALARLEGELRHSLQRPLVMLHRAWQPGRGRRKVWLAVLPCGATAYVHEGGRNAYLVTCYFPRAAVVEKKRERRWSRVVASLVLRYGQWSEDRRRLLAPPEEHRVLIAHDAANAVRDRIRFVTLAAWGFVPELEGRPWRGRLGEWEAAGLPAKPSPKQRRLRPFNKRRRDGGDENES